MVFILDAAAYVGDERLRVGQDTRSGEFSPCLSQVVSGRVGFLPGGDAGTDAEHGDSVSDRVGEEVPTRQTPAMRTAMSEGSSGARALAPNIAVACQVSTGPESSRAGGEDGLQVAPWGRR